MHKQSIKVFYFFLGESRYFTNIDHEANPISVTPKKNETLSSKKIRAHAPMQNLWNSERVSHVKTPNSESGTKAERQNQGNVFCVAFLGQTIISN